MTVRSLAELGFVDEADRLRGFVQRSSAGSVDDLQVAYGVGGERRLVEEVLPEPAGYRGNRPVRVGNRAGGQLQLDVHGYLVALTWEWHRRGHSPGDDYWAFLVEVVDAAARRWPEPDHGIWEVRGRPRHFVHSKLMCWMAIDRGLKLAEECMRRAPVRRWRSQRSKLAAEIERRGVDRRTNAFVRTFGSREPDASLLLAPVSGFVGWDDPRMVATADHVIRRLVRDDLVWRYRTADGLGGSEAAFLPCSFWLAECLARQSRLEEARRFYDRALATANDVGLYTEEHEPRSGRALGNVPQGLTHLSHIAAAVALTQAVPLAPHDAAGG
jgi:GH15 family glucan-1,4-alpha-glucosidase